MSYMDYEEEQSVNNILRVLLAFLLIVITVCTIIYLYRRYIGGGKPKWLQDMHDQIFYEYPSTAKRETNIDDIGVMTENLENIIAGYTKSILNDPPKLKVASARKLFNIYMNYEVFNDMEYEDILGIFENYVLSGHLPESLYNEFEEMVQLRKVPIQNIFQRVKTLGTLVEPFVQPPTLQDTVNDEMNRLNPLPRDIIQNIAGGLTQEEIMRQNWENTGPVLAILNRERQTIARDRAMRENLENTRPVVNRGVRVRARPKVGVVERDTNKVANRVLAMDVQNVHDSGFNLSARLALQQLKKRVASDYIPPNEVYKSISREVKSAVDNETKRKHILDVLDRIMSSTEFNGTLGEREPEILSLVWSRINSGENAKRRNDIRDILFNQLNECYDSRGNIIVCQNGRINRVLSSLDGADVDTNISNFVPMHAIETSLQEKIVNIINKEKEMSGHPEIFEKLEELTPHEEEISRRTIDNAVLKINAMRQEYENVIGGQKFTNIVQPYLETLTT